METNNTITTTQNTQNCNLHQAELQKLELDERDRYDTQTITSSISERRICNNVETTQSDDVMTLPYKINHIQTGSNTTRRALAPLALLNSNTSNVRCEREELEEEEEWKQQQNEETNPQCSKVQEQPCDYNSATTHTNNLQVCNSNNNYPICNVNNAVNEKNCIMKEQQHNEIIHTEFRVYRDGEVVHLYSPPSDHRLPNANNNTMYRNNRNREEMNNNNNRETDYHYYYTSNNNNNYSNNNYNEIQDDYDDVHTERVYVTRSHIHDNYDNYYNDDNSNDNLKRMKAQPPILSSQPNYTHSNANYYSNNPHQHQQQQEQSSPSPFKHVAVFVNPGSGNTDVAKYIKRSLSKVLLPEQVMLLNKNIFSHPEIIRHVMRKYAVIYHNNKERQNHINVNNYYTHYNQINENNIDNNINDVGNGNQNVEMREKNKPCDSVRGTVLVAGGDGTVSFIMSQLDILRSELYESGKQQQKQQKQRRTSTNNCTENREETQHNIEFTHEQLTLSTEEYRINNKTREEEELQESNHINSSNNQNELEEEEKENDDDDDTSDTCSEHSSSSGNSESVRQEEELLEEEELEQHHNNVRRRVKQHNKHTKHKWYTLPALAPLPLGTGNDFSNSVGFGHGFNRSVARQFFGGCCLGCLGWCGWNKKHNEGEDELEYSYNWSSSCNNNNNNNNDDVEHENSVVIDNNNNCNNNNNYSQKDNSVVRRLRKAINAPCVPFDRWAVDVIPLHVAQEYFVHDNNISPCSNNNNKSKCNNNNNKKCEKESGKEDKPTEYKQQQEEIRKEENGENNSNSYNNTNNIIINYNNTENEELEAILQADREYTHSAHYPSAMTVDDEYAVSVINKSVLINSIKNNNNNKNDHNTKEKSVINKDDIICANGTTNKNEKEDTTVELNNEPHYRVLSEGNAFLNKVVNENDHSATNSNLSHVVNNNNNTNTNNSVNMTVKETVHDTEPSTYTYTNTTINNKTIECSDNTIHNFTSKDREHEHEEQEQQTVYNNSSNTVNSTTYRNNESNNVSAANTCEEHDWQNDPNISSFISRVDWHGIHKDKKCKTHSVMNYFSIGYDAYIVCQFDKTRRAHPLLCSSRIHNKAIYGLLGFKAAVACQPLRKLIPLVYVPTSSSHSPPSKSQLQRQEQHLAVANANYYNGDNNNKNINGKNTMVKRNTAGPSHSPISAYIYEQHNYRNNQNDNNNNSEWNPNKQNKEQKSNNNNNFSKVNNRSIIKSCTLEQFPQLTSLQLPSDSKVLLLTNIHCYASGTHPWKPHSGTYYYKPVTFHPEYGVMQVNGNSNTNNVNSGCNINSSNNNNKNTMSDMTCDNQNNISQVNMTHNLQQDTNMLQGTSNSNVYDNTNYCANHSNDYNNNYTSNVNDVYSTNNNSNKCNKPPLHDIYINDRAFELQALGGLPHYSVLQAGIAGAAKMAQTHECFIFVLCTPADLCGQPHTLSAYTSAHYKKYMDRLLVDDMMKASLNLQMDGEALPRITEPCIIHVRPLTAHRVRVRCLTEKIILHHRHHNRSENNNNSTSHHLHLHQEREQR